MSNKTIHLLKITNYKSIDSLEVKSLGPFSVFAGPNGSGKSNFFDALDFVSTFINNGIESALRAHGGFANIHSEKRRSEYSRKFSFEISCDLIGSQDNNEKKSSTYHYVLTIHNLDKDPKVEERLTIDGALSMSRKMGESPVIGNNDKENSIEQFPITYSGLLLFYGLPLSELLRNISVYRIDPIGAKEPDQSDCDPSRLDKKGHNLASVLSRLEGDRKSRETIMEWMGMIVPGVEKIQTKHESLESKTAIMFKEQGTRKRFPAHLVSDGTVYALSMLVAALDQPKPYGLTLIEEPERGLHPAAIRELTGMMREQSIPEMPIWLSTHSESVVRELDVQELVLVNKVDGRTRMKLAGSGGLCQESIAPLRLDEMWLSNMLDGGLPW